MTHFIFDTVYGWIGIAGLVVIVCAFAAWYIPPLRGYALAIAGVVISAATIYTKGNRDATKRWNDAIERDVKKGEQARTDAARDVDAGRVRGDEWDRDKGAV